MTPEDGILSDLAAAAAGSIGTAPTAEFTDKLLEPLQGGRPGRSRRAASPVRRERPAVACVGAFDSSEITPDTTDFSTLTVVRFRTPAKAPSDSGVSGAPRHPPGGTGP